MRSLILGSVTVAALGGAVIVAGSAASQDQRSEFVGNADSDARACFRPDRGDGFSPAKIGEFDGVNLDVGAGDVYQLQFIEPCPFLKQATGIRLESTVGSGRVCNGSEVDVTLAMSVGPPMTCTVIGVRKLTPSEIAALPADERP